MWLNRNVPPARVGIRAAFAATLVAFALPLAPRPAAAAPTVTVTYLATQGGTVIGPIIKSFEKAHPNIKIVRQELPFDQLFQQIQVRLASGSTSPDIIDVDAPVVAAYAVQGFLAPLDSYFS